MYDFFSFFYFFLILKNTKRQLYKYCRKSENDETTETWNKKKPGDG